MKKVLIIGGASAIASEAAKLFARDGAHLFLADISLGRLEAVRDDIQANYKTKIDLFEINVNDYDRHDELFSSAIQSMNGIDAVLIAHGTLPDQAKAQADRHLALREFSTNGTSVISFATIAANYFEEKKLGCIAVISSVAGDRGRQSNYIYGAAKGAVSLFMQGLRNRLSKSGISVVTIKPGFVDTPMTAHLDKNPLYASPQKIGSIIHNAMKAGKSIVYAPGYWRCIMLIIKHIPEAIFKKLSL